MKKLKLKLDGNLAILSKEEMKHIFGGYGEGGDYDSSDCLYDKGECIEPKVGAWTYSTPVHKSQCEKDYKTYCGEDSGRCHYVNMANCV